MCAGHGQYPAALQHMVRQPLRARHIRQTCVEHIFNRRVATRQRVADHHRVRRRDQLHGIIALGQLYALRLELGAHRWIDIGVGASDPVPQLFGEHRQRPHERAADTKDMNMHDQPLRTSAQVNVGAVKWHPEFVRRLARTPHFNARQISLKS